MFKPDTSGVWLVLWHKGKFACACKHGRFTQEELLSFLLSMPSYISQFVSPEFVSFTVGEYPRKRSLA